jgi:hypothetical protein
MGLLLGLAQPKKSWILVMHFFFQKRRHGSPCRRLAPTTVLGRHPDIHQPWLMPSATRCPQTSSPRWCPHEGSNKDAVVAHSRQPEYEFSPEVPKPITLRGRWAPRWRLQMRRCRTSDLVADTNPKSKIGFCPAHILNHGKNLKIWSAQHPNYIVVHVASHSAIVNN